MVWDGDFPIDKPATFRGEGWDGADELTSGGTAAMSWGQVRQGGPFLGVLRAPGSLQLPPSSAFCLQFSCINAGHSGLAAASASRLTLASTAAGASRSTGVSCGPTARPPRPTGCTRARRAPAAAIPALPRSASPVSFCVPGTRKSGLTCRLSSCSADPPTHGTQGGRHPGHHRG